MFASAELRDARSGRRSRSTPLRASGHAGIQRVVARLAHEVGFDLYRDQVFHGEQLRRVLEAVERATRQQVRLALAEMGADAPPGADDWRRGWFERLLSEDEEHAALALLEGELVKLIAADLALVFLAD